jgi:hypothetical protein
MPRKAKKQSVRKSSRKTRRPSLTQPHRRSAQRVQRVTKYKVVNARQNDDPPKQRYQNTTYESGDSSAYHPGVRTHCGDTHNNWLLPQAGYLGRDSSGQQHTGTNWLGTEVDWT